MLEVAVSLSYLSHLFTLRHHLIFESEVFFLTIVSSYGSLFYNCQQNEVALSDGALSS